jgi:hypothetical protein
VLNEVRSEQHSDSPNSERAIRKVKEEEKEGNYGYKSALLKV